MCACMVCVQMYMSPPINEQRSEDNLVESLLSFSLYTGSKGGTQATGLVNASSHEPSCSIAQDTFYFIILFFFKYHRIQKLLDCVG